MTRTELPPDRTRPTGNATPMSTRRTAARQRQRMRLRRTVVLAVGVLLVSTVTARWLEDSGDVSVASAHLAAAQTITGPLRTAAGSARPATLPPRASSTPSVGAAITPVAPTLPSTPVTAAPVTPTGPGTSAPPHADDESGGSATTVPANATVTVPATGAGTVSALTIPAGEVKASGRTVRYSIEMENGLPVPTAEFAAAVQTVLTDPRGWQTKDGVRFVPVAPADLAAGAPVDVRVTLASPALTAKLCAPLDVSAQQVSCWNGSRAVLNLTRWMLGSTTYGTDLAQYRVYLISHEVGHGLGHGHVLCPGPGKPAPVMVQQTKSLEGCVASPWPTGT